VGRAFEIPVRATSAKWARPSTLAAKPEQFVERYIQEKFNVRLAEEAVSWAVVGYADFGMPGVALCGALFAEIVVAQMALAGVAHNPIASHGIRAHARHVYCSIEADPLDALVVSRVNVINGLLIALVAAVGGRYAKNAPEYIANEGDLCCLYTQNRVRASMRLADCLEGDEGGLECEEVVPRRRRGEKLPRAPG
jgi:hypothetical protein